jgi:hypothetical protein
MVLRNENAKLRPLYAQGGDQVSTWGTPTIPELKK